MSPEKTRIIVNVLKRMVSHSVRGGWVLRGGAHDGLGLGNALRLGLFLMIAGVLPLLAACDSERVRPAETEAVVTVTPTREATQQATPTSITSPGEERELAVNRIAYIGSDGDIFTINPDGTDPRQLTTTDLRAGPAGPILAQGTQSQLFYAWPTWSPDSTKLAASLVTIQGETATFSLEVLDATTGQSTRAYLNEPNSGPIARGAPHYMYWSPDSKRLAFIAATQTELAMYVTSPGNGTEPEKLIGQGPIYFAWSRDSGSLLMHRGPDLMRASFKGDSVEAPSPLLSVGFGFRTPAFSSDSSKIAYAGEDDGADALFTADFNDRLTGSRAIMELGPSAAFLWSPTADEIAVAETFSSTTQLYDRLTLVSSDGSSRRVLADELVLAFFWSPTGEKIVYVSFDQSDQSFSWKYVERSGGDAVELTEFVPSADFFTYLTFFDQYTYSNSIWSPDGSKIVFSGMVPASLRRNGGSPEEEKVYVLEVKEGAVPLDIATSRIAVWSWK